MNSREDASKRYRRTFMENNLSDNSAKISAHNYRKLATQIEKNVCEEGWNALAGVELLKDKVKAANELVDDENGINNYADACLANFSKFKNCSKDWKCSITMEDPIIQSFLSSSAEANKETKEVSDFHIKQCMKKQPDLSKATSILRSSSNERLPLPGRRDLKMTCDQTKKTSIKEEEGGGATFDIFPEEITSMSVSNPVRVKSDPVLKPSISRSRSSPNYCPPQPTTNIQPPLANPHPRNSPNYCPPKLEPPRVNPPPTKFLNNLGGYNRLTRPIYPSSRNTPFGGPRPSSPGNAPFGGPRPSSPGNTPSGGPRPSSPGNAPFCEPRPPFSNDNETVVPPPPQSSFKTAHEQLAINNQHQAKERQGDAGGFNRGGGRGGPQYGSYNQPGDGTVTPSSYGAGRKNLGTRPGPASGFKPPVRCPDDQGRNAGSGGEPKPELEDERYKNIDPKMIELITNEIMDQGAPVTWEDIAGLDFAKNTVQEIVVWPMMRPDIFTGLRGPPKGLLLFGPPGTGKTLIGKCIASQSGSTFFSISASSLTSKWVGEGEKMVRALFAVAKVNQPSVVFIDEIDSLLSSRSDTEHESSRRIKTEFLVQLDGAGPEGGERVLVVGATNRPQELDEAARRRLVKRLYIPLPEAEARNQIIHNLLAKERHEVTEKEVGEVGKQTEGYSGADMANLCKEAALGPIRSLGFGQIQSVRPDQVRPIHYRDLQNALRQVKASVSQQDLELYLDWDNKFGAGK